MVAINFGGYDTRAASSVDIDGAVNINCALGVPYLIRLDAGGNSSGSFLPRRMKLAGGTATLRYNLYRNSPRIEIWGDGTNTTYVRSGAGTGANEQIIVYGRLPERQNVAPGSYGDTITFTVEW